MHKTPCLAGFTEHYFGARGVPQPFGNGACWVCGYSPRTVKTPHVAVFDLDGTICNNDHRKHLAETKQWEAFNAACVDDTVRHAERAIAVMWALYGDVVYCTGRDARRQPETLAWMKANGLPDGELLMRPTGDHRDDAVVKYELLLNHLRGTLESVAFVVEDRDRVVAMWRSHGLTCFQCQPRSVLMSASVEVTSDERTGTMTYDGTRYVVQWRGVELPGYYDDALSFMVYQENYDRKLFDRLEALRVETVLVKQQRELETARETTAQVTRRVSALERLAIMCDQVVVRESFDAWSIEGAGDDSGDGATLDAALDSLATEFEKTDALMAELRSSGQLGQALKSHDSPERSNGEHIQAVQRAAHIRTRGHRSRRGVRADDDVRIRQSDHAPSVVRSHVAAHDECDGFVVHDEATRVSRVCGRFAGTCTWALTRQRLVTAIGQRTSHTITVSTPITARNVGKPSSDTKGA